MYPPAIKKYKTGEKVYDRGCFGGVNGKPWSLRRLEHADGHIIPCVLPGTLSKWLGEVNSHREQLCFWAEDRNPSLRPGRPECARQGTKAEQSCTIRKLEPSHKSPKPSIWWQAGHYQDETVHLQASTGGCAIGGDSGSSNQLEWEDLVQCLIHSAQTSKRLCLKTGASLALEKGFYQRILTEAKTNLDSQECCIQQTIKK